MKVIASGTFDRLHEGHKHFLMSAFNLGHVYIGLTSDTMIKNNEYSDSIQNYEDRKDKLIQYLSSENKNIGDDYQIIKIDDRLGFAVESMDADAIVVTSDNIMAAEEINDARAEYGLYPLNIIKVELILKDNKKISSTDLRREEKD